MTMPDPVSNAAKAIKISLICAAIISIFAVIGYLAYTKSVAQSQIEEDARLITALKDANQSYVEQAARANAALQSLQDEAKTNLAEAQKALAEAQKQVGQYKANQDRLLSLKPVGDDCAATKKILGGYFK